MENCIFCKIINGDIPSYTIYEDEKVKAFLDVNPKSNGHTLIVPKNHTKDMDSISNEDLLYIMEIAKKIKPILENKLNADGMTLVNNVGAPQEVKHYHLHLVPHYSEDAEIIDVKDVHISLTQ